MVRQEKHCPFVEKCSPGPVVGEKGLAVVSGPSVAGDRTGVSLPSASLQRL